MWATRQDPHGTQGCRQQSKASAQESLVMNTLQQAEYCMHGRCDHTLRSFAGTSHADNQLITLGSSSNVTPSFIPAGHSQLILRIDIRVPACKCTGMSEGLQPPTCMLGWCALAHVPFISLRLISQVLTAWTCASPCSMLQWQAQGLGVELQLTWRRARWHGMCHGPPWRRCCARTAGPRQDCL